MRSQRKTLGRAQSEILIVAAVTGIILIYFLHRMAVNQQAKSHVVAALTTVKSVEQAAMDYREANKEWPESIYDMHLTPHMSWHGAAFTTEFLNGELILTFDSDQDRLAGKTLVLDPPTGVVIHDWSCTGGSVVADYRPKSCLSYSL